MKYRISKSLNICDEFIEINKEEFIDIKSAREKILEILYLEEKFDLVVENYLEFETELLTIAAKRLLDKDLFSITQHMDRNLINRRIMNLLSVCKSYLQQCERHLIKIYGRNSSILYWFLEKKNLYIENNFSYKFMEALRNYVQHYGIPVHIIGTHHGISDSNDPESDLQLKVIPYVSKEELKGDKQFTSLVIPDLNKKQYKNRIDLRPFIREYIESIGEIHENLREKINNDTIFWEEKLENCYINFNSHFDFEETSSINIFVLQDDLKLQERIHITKNILDRKRFYERKNKNFKGLHRSFTTNQV